MITELIRYSGLLAIALCAMGCQSPDLSDYTYTDYKFEREYYEEIQRMEKTSPEEIGGEMAEIRSALGPMAGALAVLANSDAKNKFATSEENIRQLTYDVFTGDVLCWRNVKENRGVVEEQARKIVLLRARSLCNAYPLTEQCKRRELISMTLFLANCYAVVGNVLPTAFSGLDRDTEREQYPFLVAMAACGDEGARKKISRKVKDNEELFHLVKIFSACSGIEEDDILDGGEGE